MGDFNRDFRRLVKSKLALQGSKARNLDAGASLKSEQAGVVGADSRSAIDLNAANAGLARERTGLLGREVESSANYRDQLARTSRIGANIALGEGTFKLDPDKFAATTKNFEGAGVDGASVFNAPGANVYGDDISSSVRGIYGAPFYPGRGDNREKNMGILRKLPNSNYYAEGGLVDDPMELGFANGGVVPGGVDSSLVGDYELYRKAAAGAGVPALPMREAIPRMAQLRADKRQGVLSMIAQGGTTPQGFAEGGEINGPGTGKSDSIPAVVDGVAPAAVSDGEFHIPKHVVDYFGTKMFDGLVEKARLAGKANGRKQGQGYAQGGAVKKPVKVDPTVDYGQLRPEETAAAINPQPLGAWRQMPVVSPPPKLVLTADAIKANAAAARKTFNEKAEMEFPKGVTIDGVTGKTYGDVFSVLQEMRGRAPFGIIPAGAGPV